jgi:hypothetical protein
MALSKIKSNEKEDKKQPDLINPSKKIKKHKKKARLPKNFDPLNPGP